MDTACRSTRRSIRLRFRSFGGQGGEARCVSGSGVPSPARGGGTGRGSRLLMAGECRPCPRTRLPASLLSMNRSPVKRHGSGAWRHEEQAHGRGFTGFDACIFLLIQAKYRGFTETGGIAKVGVWRGSHPAVRPAFRPRSVAASKKPGRWRAPEHNSNCGFSPIMFFAVCQKSCCQESIWHSPPRLHCRRFPASAREGNPATPAPKSPLTHGDPCPAVGVACTQVRVKRDRPCVA